MQRVAREKRHRGRPRTVEGRAVYESLVNAAERCISEHGTADVSGMEIARAAGTADTMINYYFGSKDQLMVLVMKRAVQEMCEELDELEATLLQSPGNPTWHIVTTCASFAAKHSACAKIFPVRDAQIQRDFYSRLETTVHARLTSILQSLIKAGIYSPHLDMRYATYTLGVLVNSPNLFAFAMPMHDLTAEDLLSNAWLTYMTSMLDQQFRNPQRLNRELILESLPASAAPRTDALVRQPDAALKR